MANRQSRFRLLVSCVRHYVSGRCVIIEDGSKIDYGSRGSIAPTEPTSREHGDTNEKVRPTVRMPEDPLFAKQPLCIVLDTALIGNNWYSTEIGEAVYVHTVHQF